MKANLLVALFIILFLSITSKEPDAEIEIQTKSLGAELTSLKYKGIEYLHDGLSFWDQHSPILFPIVGKLRYDETIINGETYEIPKHGFAMNSEFEKIGDHAYILTSNNETLDMFPFDFELYVTYKVDKNKLFFNYTVINKTPRETMLFGIGGHPGFKCEYYKEKCEIEFEQKEEHIKIIPVNITEGIMSTDIIDGNTVIVDKQYLKIKKDSFINDAIVFTDMTSKSVFLKNDGKKILKFNYDGFKYLGIWSAKGNAPYVCLEPWYNTPDYTNSTKEFSEKKDIIKLESGDKFEIGFSVEIIDDDGASSIGTNLKYFSLLTIICLIGILI